MSSAADKPRVLIEPGPSRPDSKHCEWLTTWRIRNLSGEPISLQAVRLPFDRFRSAEQDLSASPLVAPNTSASIEISVQCNEAPDTVLTSPFLILLIRWRDRDWRILGRLRVEFDERSTPQPICEAVTVQAMSRVE